MTYSASEVNKVFKAQSTDDGRLKNNVGTPTIMHEVIFQHLRTWNVLQKAQNIDIKTVHTANMNGNTVPITEN